RQASPGPRRRGPPPAPGEQATPGPRRSLRGWLSSGRLVSLVIFLAACGALAYLFTDERFSVRRVEVEGNRALDAAAVSALADVLGRPVWFVHGDVAAARLRENAYVASASVELALPDLAIIRIVERRPEVRWQAGGVQYLVDGTGKVLAAAQEPAEADVLVITDSSHMQLGPNDQLDLDAIQLAQSLALKLPVELGFTPAQIGWDYGLGVYVRSAAGQTIVFGQSEEVGRKLAVLDVLLKEQTAFTYLDLRPDNPFYQNVASAPALSQTVVPGQ
ncbi:MAG: FtsQ-type POTRA domain-containing protein, partial [Chloroflexales bacterium]|nr:FtsQ-type POTRA domain-containing protein [Chloroflexales bacterium]